LTEREREVLSLVARGMTNAEIAGKLRARDRTQAVVLGYQTGLVPLRPER